MKVLVVDSESDVRGNYRRLLREVGGRHDEYEEDPEEAEFASQLQRPRSRPAQFAKAQHHAHPAHQTYEEPQTYQDEYAEPEGYGHPHSFVGSEPMSSFAQSSDSQFAAAEQAVLQSPRGRWFLSEYLRRHRSADTERVLAAVESLKGHLATPPHEANTVNPTLRRELQDIAVTIVQARRDVAALKTETNGPTLGQTNDDLDTVVAGSERSIGDILSSVERLQDVALRLRSKGIEQDECETIEAQAITILRACSSQDITGQRVSRIVNALRIIEQRVTVALDAIIASEGGHPIMTTQDFDRSFSQPHNSTSTHTQAQRSQTQTQQSQEGSWVTPAADRIIRSESASDTEPSHEHSVARAY